MPGDATAMTLVAYDIEYPDAVDARAALERIVGSDRFAASPRLANFLRFVVETTLSGQSECLKGYTVGVGALGRPDSFDPQTDPIVRVEAVRLRRALARYYAGAGARDPVVIEMPRGRYVPRFRWARRSAARIGWRYARRALQRLLAAGGP